MSIFSKIKESRKAAKTHKEKIAAKEVDVTVPYKHVPTHAAVDALSGAPSTWKADDRSKIKEHHKRRSQMAISRTASSLSTVSYLNPAAGSSSQAPPMPRNSSYSSYNPTWNERGDQSLYPTEAPTQKRYKVSRGQSTGSVTGHHYHDSGIGPSPLASNYHSERESKLALNPDND